MTFIFCKKIKLKVFRKIRNGFFVRIGSALSIVRKHSA